MKTKALLNSIIGLILTTLLLGFSPTPIQAQDASDTVTLAVIAGTNIRFAAFTGEEGLSSGSVFGITQDEHGFLWFATGDGLSRYDGYVFRIFRFDRGNPNSLSNNNIMAILQGQNGVLWLATNGGGVDRFDPVSETFTHYRHDPDNPNSLSGNAIPKYGLYEDRQGTLWIGTVDSGLNRLDPATGTVAHYYHDPQDPNSLSSNTIESVYQDSSGMLWIGTFDAGLNRLDPVSGQITRYLPDPEDPHTLPAADVRGIYEDRTGTLWMGTQNGFVSLDQQTGQFTRYVVAPDRSDAASLNAINLFHEDSMGNLWLGTDGAGILQFDRQQQQVVQYKNDPANPRSLRNNFVSSFWQDPSGTLWVGTQGGGANLVSTRPPKFAHYKHEADNPDSVADNFILSIFEDQAGIVWIGNDRTLNRWDRQSNTWEVYRNDPANPASISNGSVTAIQEDPDGTLWFGTYRGGLNRFDPQTGQFKAYRFDANDPHSLSDDIIRSLYRDSHGVLWVGGWNNGLNRFDRTTETFQRYLRDPDDPSSLSGGSVTDIYEDRAHTLWVATEGGGLNRFDPTTETFQNFQNDPQNLNSLPNNAVRVLYEDRAGQFWIGTVGGLCAFDRTSGICTMVYTDKEGLPNNTIEGILEDEQGNLWISTNNGLSCFNPQTRAFRNYDALDGLQSNEFTVFTAFYKSPRSGEMYFGGMNGFNVFDPSQVVDDPFVPSVVFTDFRLLGKSVLPGGDSVLQKNINQTDELTLSYNQNDISFEFSALSYVAPAKNLYRYKLEGFDTDWRQVDSTERLAVYTNLDAGSYVFRVQGTNEDGVWNEQGTALNITITPPWWETWWFRGVAGLMVVGLFAAGYSYRVRNLRRRARDLETQVAERTRELTERTQELQIAKDVAEEAQRLAEVANQAKSVFLANMSHELRTPLNSILGYAQILQQRSGEPETIHAMKTIQQSGSHLLTLINDVLDTAKVEAGKLTLLPITIHFPTFLETIVEIIRSRTGEKQLYFTCETTGTMPEGILADEIRLRQVVLNLLSNAVKFTDAGQVMLRVTCLDAPDMMAQHPTPHSLLRFEVEDTGIGITPDQLEKIFQPFEQVGETSRRSEGTGLGLAISRQLVQLMGGDLFVESKLGQGSRFWFEIALPVTEISAKPVESSDRKYAGYRDPRRTVLVVDDVASNRAMLVDLLAPLGFEVIEAADGQQAITAAQETRPDVILMDRRMPVMNGLTAAQQIRQLPELTGTPIISVSASVSDEDQVASLAADYDAFLPKPIQWPRLAALIERLLQLEWIYEEVQGEDLTISETTQDIIAPPQAELEQLLELALQGKMRGIRERATHLETLDARYTPFARSLHDLAEGFETQQILVLIKRYLEEKR